MRPNCQDEAPGGCEERERHSHLVYTGKLPGRPHLKKKWLCIENLAFLNYSATQQLYILPPHRCNHSVLLSVCVYVAGD